MLDYLRIMLDARLAKMDERGASAVEYGLLVSHRHRHRRCLPARWHAVRRLQEDQRVDQPGCQ